MTTFQYRATLGETPGAWHDTLDACLSGISPLFQPLRLEPSWTVFALSPHDTPSCAPRDAMDYATPTYTHLPDTLCEHNETQGTALQTYTIEQDERGILDFTPHCGPGLNKRVACAYTTITLESDQEILWLMGADWCLQLHVNGERLIDTFGSGNGMPLLGNAFTARSQLPAGTHTVAVKVIGGSEAWALACEAYALTMPEAVQHLSTVEAQSIVPLRWPDAASLRIENPRETALCYQGEPITGEFPGMRYKTLEGIPLPAPQDDIALGVTWSGDDLTTRLFIPPQTRFEHVNKKQAMAPSIEVFPQYKHRANISIGPLQQGIYHDRIILVCKTDTRISVTCSSHDVRQPAQASAPGLTHVFHWSGLASGEAYTFDFKVGDSHVTYTAKTHDPQAPLRIGIVSDPSPRPTVFRQVLEELNQHGPDILLQLGDLCGHGDYAWVWADEWYAPVRDSLGDIPLLSVNGNHDKQSPLYDALLRISQPHWVQDLGQVVIIGLDGEQPWLEDGDDVAWLTQTLQRHEDKSIIVCNHYPIYTVTPHGRLAADGHPVEPPLRQAQDIIGPLLQQYNITAYFNGHSHCYERSQVGNLPTFTLGGGGGYLYTAKGDTNPYIHQFVPEHHFALLDVSEKELELSVIGLNQAIIDKRSLHAAAITV